MPRSLFPVLLAVPLALAACGGGGPEGTYILDKDAMKKELASQMEDAMGAEMMEQVLPDMDVVLEIKPDKTFHVSMTMMGSERVSEGTWELTGAGSNELRMVLVTREGAPVSEPEEITGTFDGEALHIEESGVKMTMRRQ